MDISRFHGGVVFSKHLMVFGLVYLAGSLAAAAYSGFPTGRTSVDALLWLAGVGGLIYGSARALLAYRERQGYGESELHPLWEAMFEVCFLLVGLALVGLVAPSLFRPEPDRTATYLFGGLGLLFTLSGAVCIYRKLRGE
jgi:hypothetical protein